MRAKSPGRVPRIGARRWKWRPARVRHHGADDVLVVAEDPGHGQPHIAAQRALHAEARLIHTRVFPVGVHLVDHGRRAVDRRLVHRHGRRAGRCYVFPRCDSPGRAGCRCPVRRPHSDGSRRARRDGHAARYVLVARHPRAPPRRRPRTGRGRALGAATSHALPGNAGGVAITTAER